MKRRDILKTLQAGAAGVAATRLASAQTAPAKDSRWEAARHDKDDWLERPAKHRLVLDTTEFAGLGEALAFAANYVRVNKTDYGVAESDLALLLIVRHRSTPFGYTDAIWQKYGGPMAKQSRVEDPKSKEAPKVNMYETKGYEGLENRGVTFGDLAKQGVVFGVCSVASRGYAGVIAQAVGGDADSIYKELIANLIPNGRMVPAGIVAVSRAQERGYTLVKA